MIQVILIAWQAYAERFEGPCRWPSLVGGQDQEGAGDRVIRVLLENKAYRRKVYLTI